VPGGHDLLLGAGLVAAPLFITVFLIEGFARPGYSAVRLPVSSLALAPRGWIQQTNFVATGALMLVLAIGVLQSAVSVWGGSMLVVYAIGLIGAGVFVTGPVGGYTGRGADDTAVHDPARAVHLVFSLLVFTALPAACFTVAGGLAPFGLAGWAGYSVLTGILVLVGIVLAGVPPLSAILGLVQRLTIAVGWSWIFVFALLLLRSGH
jgi:hypothetical protein